MRPLSGFGLVILLLLGGCRGSGTANEGPCPANVPTAGAACPFPDPYVHACEYGGDGNTDCTTLVDCATETGSTPLHWIVIPPQSGCGTNPTACPRSSLEVVEGSACTPGVANCLYTDAICGCLTCATDGGFGGFMHCRPRSDVAAGCPTPRPRLGTPCSSDGLVCDYGRCCDAPSLGSSMRCAGGYWRFFLDGACACAAPRSCPTR